MKYKSVLLLILTIGIFVPQLDVVGQSIGRGDFNARRVGVHDGNQVRTVFSNWGVIAQPGSEGPMAAWKYNTNGYVGDVSPVVGVKLPNKFYIRDGKTLATPEDNIYSVIVTPVSRPGGGDNSPGGGTHWGFEPIPGFFNPDVDEIGKGIAMSHQKETWPTIWPDQPTWVDKDGFAEWNGYFGRNQFNSDQESYFLMDDNTDEKMFTRYGFLPDSTDETRRGQGLRMSVRGLQWANFIAQDVVFWLYEISNIGTTTYDQVVFGTLVGTYVGADGDEWNDDVSFFQVRDNITYSWDFDHRIRPSANPRWQPNANEVGYIGYAFLESPGNQFDGIDNDADNRNYNNSANYFTEADFEPRLINVGDDVIITTRNNGGFTRSTFTIPNQDTVKVISMEREFVIIPGETELSEGDLSVGNNRVLVLNPNAYDGYDNDLDGLIDENYQLHYRQYKEAVKGQVTTVLIDTLNPVQYVNYFDNVGANDLMLDEGRSDGIDNDNDWSRDPETGELLFNEDGNYVDDVGQDGKIGSNDIGENDGIPTLGEPNFDKLDVDESDQIGLTSFQYFVPAGDITMSDEDDMWQRLRPGNFEVPSSIVNNVAIRGEDGDFMYGSGYFPLLAGTTERFSLALAFGDDLQGILKTKRVAQIIYDANYNFPKPPDKPTLTAVAGDGKVTLYWDKKAEISIDPTTKQKDFEGYKIYKGTDPDFSDAFVATDGFGNPKDYKPHAQFDLDNDISGFFDANAELVELSSGKPFYLGGNTGIQNTFVDEDVENGRTYYYAVVAYDRGKAESNIFPSENSKAIRQDAAGNIQLDINTALVIPTAPVAGYVPPSAGEPLTRVSGKSEPTPYFEVIDPTRVEDAEYELTFVDSLIDGIDIAYAYNVVNKTTSDTLINKSPDILGENGEIFEGITLSIDPSYQTEDSVKINLNKSGWNNDNEDNLRTTVAVIDVSTFKGVKDPKDYKVVFYSKYDKSSTANLVGLPIPARKTNFEVYDVTFDDNPQLVPYSAIMKDTALQKGDRIFLSNVDGSKLTWAVDFLGDSVRVPTLGDTLSLSFNKPLTSSDKFTFTTTAASYNKDEAKVDIKEVGVVPNPYVVTNVFEQPLPPQIRGRGERVINFIKLPPNSTINIYTSSGNHVRTIYHEGGLNDGSVSWDLRTKEGLDVAYGVYFYIVEAEGISEKKFGKIAIIK